MVNQCRVASMLPTDVQDHIVVVEEVEAPVVAVIEVDVVTTAIAIEENQKQQRKREVTRKMTMINLKLMKSQDVLMVIVVEGGEEGVEAVVVVAGDG